MKHRLDIRKYAWVKMVPNALTLCNSLCGFAAILYMLRAYEAGIAHQQQLWIFSVSAIMIFSAMIFDAFDGFAARLLNASSIHGIQMDSLSDMVTFGVAPATLVAIMTHCLRNWELDRPQEVLVYLLSSIYLSGAALRLATYNVLAMQEKKSSDHFSGLPSPGAAAAICVTVFFAYDTRIELDKLAFVLPIYAALLGLLMTSKIPYIHAGKWIQSMRRHPKRLLLFLLLLLFAIVFRVPGLALVVTGYVLSGPVAALISLFRRKPESPAPEN